MLAPGSSAGMSPLLPHPSAYSRRRQSSQQSVIASGRLQLILLEEFHQPPLPKLLRGSLVTSQIPPHTRLQSQTLQGWDSSVRLSGQHKQPPKAQVLMLHLQFHELMLHFSRQSLPLRAELLSVSPLLPHARPRGSPCSHTELVLSTDLFPRRCSWECAEKA